MPSIQVRSRRRRIRATSALALLSALSACAVAASASSAKTEARSASAGTLVVDTSFIINTADPARDLDPTGYIVDHAIYDTLLTEDGANTKPVADLATSYKASPNAKVYTFYLRHNAKFSNGDPVTSADVVFSLERVIHVNSAPAYLLAGIRATARGPYTVVLTSSAPNPAIPAIVTTPALGIVDKKVVMAHGGSDAPNASKTDKAEQFLDTTSAGSGPYVLTSFSTNNQITLTANPYYWGPKPKFQKVVLRNMSAATQYLNVQRGADQIALDLSSQQANQLKTNSSLQVHTGASPNVFFLQMTENAKVSPTMANHDIQEAIRYGLGYQGMIATAGTGAIQAAGIVPKQFLGSLPTSDAIKQNIAKAKQLVKASGIKNPSATMAYPSGINVNGLSFATLAQRVQANLAQIGIKITLSAVPVNVFLNNYNADKYALVQSYWGPDYADPNDYLVFVPGGSVATRSDWPASADPSLAALGKRAGSTSNNARRKVLFQTIQRDLNANSPFVNMIQPAEAIVGSSNLTGVVDNPSWILSVQSVGTK